MAVRRYVLKGYGRGADVMMTDMSAPHGETARLTREMATRK